MIMDFLNCAGFKEGWIIDLLKFSIRLCSIIQRKIHTPHLLPLRNKTQHSSPIITHQQHQPQLVDLMIFRI